MIFTSRSNVAGHGQVLSATNKPRLGHVVRSNAATAQSVATVHADGIAGDQARLVGREEGNNATDIVGLRKAL
jgi:hypothetical protein